jgi:hypothetical protein
VQVNLEIDLQLSVTDTALDGVVVTAALRREESTLTAITTSQSTTTVIVLQSGVCFATTRVEEGRIRNLLVDGLTIGVSQPVRANAIHQSHSFPFNWLAG